MTEQQDSILTFGAMIAICAAIAAAAGVQVMLGFTAGVIVTLGAAAIAAADFD